MTVDCNGRQVYCVVTDQYGNSVNSETVTLTCHNTAEIIDYEFNIVVEDGATAKMTVLAIGDGLNLSRMRRQEEYLRNLVPAMQAAMEEDETFPIRVYEQIADYTVTDCTAPIISRLAEDYGDYSLGEIYSVPGENRMGKEYMEFYADEEALDELILELFYAPKK